MQLQLIASPRQFLQLLLSLRACAVVGQSVTIVVIQRWLGIDLPIAHLSTVIAVFAVLSLLSGLRLRTTTPATEVEVAVQLLIDVAELTLMLCLSGGTANPFASLYLIPVALAAVGLGWQYAVIVTAACLGCYLYLVDRSTSLMFMHMNLSNAFDLHVVGMHVTFVLSAVLLVVALSLMAAGMRRRDQAMAALREEMLRKEHLSAMGILAAGAAHELGTPLLSMALLIGELRAARAMDAEFQDNLALLEKQIALSKQKLSALLLAAGNPRAPCRRVAPIYAVLQEVLDSWSILRPAVNLEVDRQGLQGDPLVSVDDGFAQALITLLDNSAEASASTGSDRVRVILAGDAQGIRLYLDDEGPGLSAEVRQRAGTAIFTTKKTGFGLGLVLSHANLERLQGALTLTARPEGGTRTTIWMPAGAPEVTRAHA